MMMTPIEKAEALKAMGYVPDPLLVRMWIGLKLVVWFLVDRAAAMRWADEIQAAEEELWERLRARQEDLKVTQETLRGLKPHLEDVGKDGHERENTPWSHNVNPR